VDLKWRIFQRASAAARQVSAVLADAAPLAQPTAPARGDTTAAAARVQRALEALPAAVLVIDMSDTIVSWNHAAEGMFDVPVASALARKFRDLDVSYRVEGLRARIEEVKARHAPVRIEDVTFARRNGDLIHVDISIAPLFEGYRLIGVVVYGIEATEHARLKEQMARVAEQHATAIEELQSTNEELETTNEELQSTNEELETTVEELQAANSELGALNAELEGRSAELKRVDAYHLSLLNSMENSIFVTDRSLIVTTWNQASERMWGIRAEQAVGRDLAALPLGDMARTLRPVLNGALRSEAVMEVADVPYTLPGGEVRNALVKVAPLRDEVGSVIGLIGVGVPADASGSRGTQRR
jgi:two-component system CheB/CheR fusion protein